uniref:DUF4407 domain-containing protein n=2 Tax=Nocardia TaxID=1817 RepID=UPI0024553652
AARALIRLGGGQPDLVAEAHERSGYALTGTAVLVSALVAGGLAAAACAPVWSAPVAAAAGAGVAAVAGVIARVLAVLPGTFSPGTAAPGTAQRVLGLLGRMLLALLPGLFLGEAATLVATAPAIDRLLDEKAHAAASSAPEVTAATAVLERARAEQAALRATIGRGAEEVERALVTARCEFNPTPACPPTRITGVPGDGPEHRTARAMLDEARARLAADRDRAPALDQRVTEADSALARAYATAERSGDRGLGARWAAMHEHTTSAAPGPAMTTRLAALLAGLLLALLPLLARRRLGVTSQDRHAAARAAMDAAERDAETAVAIQLARMRAAAARSRAEPVVDTRRPAAARRAAALPTGSSGSATWAVDAVPFDPEYAAARTAVTDDPGKAYEATPVVETTEPVVGTGDRVVEPFGGRRHTRVIAAFGGLEIGITEAVRPAEHGRPPRQAPAPSLSWLAPLLPGFVLAAVDSATRPLLSARRAVDAVEELTFTVRDGRHTRVVTLAVRETAAAGPSVATTVVDAEPVAQAGPQSRTPAP